MPALCSNPPVSLSKIPPWMWLRRGLATNAAISNRARTGQSISSGRGSARRRSGSERQDRASVVVDQRRPATAVCSATVSAFARGVIKNGGLVMLLAPVLTPHGVLTLRPSGGGDGPAGPPGFR